MFVYVNNYKFYVWLSAVGIKKYRWSYLYLRWECLSTLVFLELYKHLFINKLLHFQRLLYISSHAPFATYSCCIPHQRGARVHIICNHYGVARSLAESSPIRMRRFPIRWCIYLECMVLFSGIYDCALTLWYRTTTTTTTPIIIATPQMYTLLCVCACVLCVLMFVFASVSEWWEATGERVAVQILLYRMSDLKS